MQALARRLTAAGIAALVLLAGPAAGQDQGNTERKLEKVLEDRLGVSDIQSIRKSPVEGLYEVVLQNQVLYASPDGRYLIQGQIFDTRERTNLTAQRKRELQTREVAWSGIPLDKGVAWGDPEGHKLAVFSDPMCPHCRDLHHQLQEMDNVRVYELMMPLESIHKGATEKSRRILCASDPVQALHDTFSGKELSAPADCDAASSVSATLKYAKSKGWTGTPVLVRSDGKVLLGAPESREALRNWLEKADS